MRHHDPGSHTAVSQPRVPEAGRAFDELIMRVVGRQQGIYWVDADGRREVGPFPSVQVALRDMARAGERASSPFVG